MFQTILVLLVVVSPMTFLEAMEKLKSGERNNNEYWNFKSDISETVR
jgi:hypothetical protein